ncbi:MAG: M55 family metallopeptidase [Armatimonadota bacterium]|nr:M55 family metallopeptidase [Armatimonadota bacterium]
MKVYIVTDLEGVAGVTQWDPRHEGNNAATALARRRFARWLTEEVNAAARGLFAGGATEVIVNDGHGAGQTIDVEHVDPRIKIFHGTERPNYCTGLDETCDAIASVGTHAKAGTEHGNLAHTMGTGVRGYWINGVSVGETGLQAFLAGEYGVPYVFCAGDEWAVREMQQLVPGCVGAAVKYGTSTLSALTCTPQRAREIIEEGAERAMQGIGEVEPLEPGSPVLFREEHHEPVFDPEEPREGCRIIDAHTLEIEADTLKDLLDIKYGYDPDWTPAWAQPWFEEA